MKQVGLLYHSIFLEHKAPQGHVERPERLMACVEALQDAGLWQQFIPIDGRQATLDEAALFHDYKYLMRLKNEIHGKAGFLDGDTFYSPRTIEAAFVAVGGIIDLVLSVWQGKFHSGLALVRPPGHHAEKIRAAGFCILGNIAIAATVARNHGARVAIIDFDVHHGNGTQQAFYEDPLVLVICLHRHGRFFFPGSGGEQERGQGAGFGTTVNIPLPPGSGNEAYLLAFDEQVWPALKSFQPDILLVSAGFDAHIKDPVGGMEVDDRGFQSMITRIGYWAEELCQGKWVAVLEGGYDLKALAAGVVSLGQVMLGYTL